VFAELRLAIQLAIGIVFLLSSVGKLRHSAEFGAAIMQYKILPVAWAYPVGVVIISVEVWVAFSHLTGFLLAFAIRLGLAMLVSFTVAVVVNLRRGQALPCYCFGDAGDTISRLTLARLVLLMSGEAFLLTIPGLRTTNQQIISSLQFYRLSVPQLAVAFFWAVFLLIVYVWFLSVADIVRLLRPMPNMNKGTR
jgi:hypothetical protein